MKVWSEVELTSQGVSVTDEGLHTHAPGDPTWNESVFFDWIDSGGELAGHCRIGRHPGLGHLWLWVYLYDGERWVGLDLPRLPLSDVEAAGWSYEGEALAFSWRVETPLSASVLSLRGVGRVLDGAEEGERVPFTVELRYRAAGPAHGMAARRVKGKDGETYLAGRYEQPCDVEGGMTLGERAFDIAGRGERDHSWGPRHWAMQWLFLVLAGERLRAQCTEVLIGRAMRICVGYVQRQEMSQVTDTRFDLTFFEPEEVHAPFEGSVRVDAGGEHLSGRLVPLSGVALDDSHALPKGTGSIYRRNLVRFEPEDGGEPILGWMETHRLTKAE